MSNQEVQIAEGVSAIEPAEQQGTVVNEINIIDYEQLKTQAGFIQVTPFNEALVRHQEWEAASTAAHLGMLIKAMGDDANYAWKWHSAIAVNMHEAGCDPKTAQIGAAKFLHMLTQGAYDPETSPFYKQWMENWEATTPKEDEVKEGDNKEVGPAMKIVTDALCNDPGYAWSWQANIAMASIDEGNDRLKSQKAAARFLSMLTKGGCDMNNNPTYIGWMKDYEAAENAPAEDKAFEEVQGTGGIKSEDDAPTVKA